MLTGLSQRSVNGDVFTRVAADGACAAPQALCPPHSSAVAQLPAALLSTASEIHLHAAAAFLLLLQQGKKKKLVFLKAVWSGGCISFCCDVFVLVSCFFFSFPSSSTQPLCFPVSGFVFTLLTKLCILTCTFFFLTF